MKTTTMMLLAISLLSAAGFTSCKKGDVIKSNTELLTQKAWQFETYGLDENNNGIVDQSENEMLSCESDDLFTFSSNGTGLYATGSLTCSPDNTNMNFNWLFTNNETELTIFAYPEKIDTLNENTLETYYDAQNSQGQPVKYIRRFKH